jgi:hypothetical protein
MKKETSEQFRQVSLECERIFLDKMSDYGSAWRVFRTSSLTDQIYIKANRIRTIQTKGNHLVDEGIVGEFQGIFNYAVMAIIQFRIGTAEKPDLDINKAIELYRKIVSDAHELMSRKNHDYDEAWRNMRVSSLTDIILVKLLRIKQIEDNQGSTKVSEGIDANFFDIMNYAVFALILLKSRID